MSRRGRSRRFWGNAPFSPAALGASLIAWYRSDKGITIGTGVSSWADLSGNGHNATQGTPANQPTYNTTGGGGTGTFPYVSCATSGGAISLATSAFTLTQPNEVFLEAKWTSEANFRYIFDGAAVGNTIAILDNAAVNSFAIDAGTLLSGTVTPSGWQTWDAVFNGASSSLTVAGSLIASGAAGAGPASGIILFNAQSLVVSPIAGLAEVIVTNALTAGQRGQVLNYLHSRYGNQ